MYKSKLQELCQQRSWELPTYESSRQGQAHNPRFLATVTVNDISFHSPSPSNTSKKAQNDAAKLAYEHFSNSRPSPPLSGSFSERAGAITCLPPGGTLQLNTQNANHTSQINEVVAVAKTAESFGGSFSERAGAVTCLPHGGTLPLNTQNANQTSQINEVVGVAKTAESFGGSFSERAGAITCLPPGGKLQLNTQNANQTSQINEVAAVAKTDESFRGTLQLNAQNANQTSQINEVVAVAKIDESFGSFSGRVGAITCLSPGGTLQLNAQNANQTSQINEVEAVAKNSKSFGGCFGERAGAINCLSPGVTLQFNTQNANETSQINEVAAIAKNDEGLGGSFSERAVGITCLSTKGTLQLNTQNANQTSQINEVVAVAKNGESFRGSLSVSTEVNSHLSLRGSMQLNTQNANQTPQVNDATTVARSDERSGDMQHLSKSQLQTYAQKRNFALPVYSCERVGPPHASRFKCKVTVNGHTFESLEYFPILNKAENAAAKAALMSLLPNGVDEDESGYKNLLQELAQREGCGLPTYSTNKSGEAHIPTFTSTVEIKGEIFTGQGAKTKKQAEMSAAKTAYTALKQRNSNQSPAFLSPACQFQEAPQSSTLLAPAVQAQEAVQSTSCLSPAHQGHKAQQFSTPSLLADLTAFLQQNIQPKLPVSSEQDEKDRACSEVSSHHPFIASSGKYSVSAVTNIASSSGAAISSLPKHDQSSSSLPPDSSTSSAASLSIEHLVGRGTSSQSRNIIHPRGTRVTYPPGTTVLPISDDNWVAVKIPPQLSQSPPQPSQ